MDQFERSFEDMDVRSEYVEQVARAGGLLYLAGVHSEPRVTPPRPEARLCAHTHTHKPFRAFSSHAPSPFPLLYAQPPSGPRSLLPPICLATLCPCSSLRRYLLPVGLACRRPQTMNSSTTGAMPEEEVDTLMQVADTPAIAHAIATASCSRNGNRNWRYAPTSLTRPLPRRTLLCYHTALTRHGAFSSDGGRLT